MAEMELTRNWAVTHTDGRPHLHSNWVCAAYRRQKTSQRQKKKINYN